MEPLNISRININAPYKVWNEDQSYRFETDNGISYVVDFDSDDNPYFRCYWFNLTNPRHAKSPGDLKIAQTVVCIIEEFFHQNPDVLLYMCSTDNGQQAQRSRLFLHWFSGYEEEGYLAWDDVDGDLTAQVQFELLEDKIEYRVSDRAGNETVVERELPAATAPELTLLGDEHMTITARMDFEDPGFTAVDGKGKDLSDLVTVEGSVTPYRLGEYELTYSLSNGEETLSVTRTVEVEPVELPPVVQPDEKTIYLTFDDGPGPYTDALLDVLAAYDVKATFFVTQEYPDYEDVIGRAFREGHSIGVHTSSHNYYQIYASEQAYLDDFYTMQEIIYRQTGSYTQMFRFPGGSSNTVSNFNPGIISRLTGMMNSMGYQYYDWHVDSGDAGGTRTTAGVVANVTSGCAERRTTVVLQHDVKDYSVAAVEDIIIWGRQNGYTFRALDLTSPTAHHRIAN